MPSLALAVSKESAGESILVGSSADLGNSHDMIGPGTQIRATPQKDLHNLEVSLAYCEVQTESSDFYCRAFASALWSNNSYTNSK